MKHYKVKHDLQERVITFAVDIISLVESLSRASSTNLIGGRVLRSGTAPAFNYAEARSAESRSAFIHKMNFCLKELHETHTCLKVVRHLSLSKIEYELRRLLKECAELVSIFASSIQSAKAKYNWSNQKRV